MSFPKDRKQMFDIAVAGPLFGFIASLTALFMGLSMTMQATQVGNQEVPRTRNAHLKLVRHRKW